MMIYLNTHILPLLAQRFVAVWLSTGIVFKVVNNFDWGNLHISDVIISYYLLFPGDSFVIMSLQLSTGKLLQHLFR